MSVMQPWHLIFVLGIALLVFGPKKLPELGRNLGHGMRDFKNAVSGDDETERRLDAAAAIAAARESSTAPDAEHVGPVVAAAPVDHAVNGAPGR